VGTIKLGRIMIASGSGVGVRAGRGAVAERQRTVKVGTGTGLAFDGVDTAVVTVHYLSADEQAEAHPDAGFLCGETRLEDAADVLGCDALGRCP
jgi:hypothetical protein